MMSSELPRRRVLVACNDPQTARKLRTFFEDERTLVVDTDVDDAVERLARNEAYDLIVADASDRGRENLRQRLADTAPEALMRMFEITSSTLPGKAFEHPSGFRLALVPDLGTRRGAR